MNNRRIMSWEGHLIQQAALGDTIAFELLADRYRDPLRGLAMRILRNVDDANDAVQETFLRAFRAIRHVDADRPIKPWLSRICTNCCVDAVRSRRQTEPIEAHEHRLFAPEAGAEDQVEESFLR